MADRLPWQRFRWPWRGEVFLLPWQRFLEVFLLPWQLFGPARQQVQGSVCGPGAVVWSEDAGEPAAEGDAHGCRRAGVGVWPGFVRGRGIGVRQRRHGVRSRLARLLGSDTCTLCDRESSRGAHTERSEARVCVVWWV